MTLDARGASRRARDPETDPPPSFFESPIRVEWTMFRGDLDASLLSWSTALFSPFPTSSTAPELRGGERTQAQTRETRLDETMVSTRL